MRPPRRAARGSAALLVLALVVVAAAPGTASAPSAAPDGPGALSRYEPGTGWTFSVVLHGQDGFQPDRARPFAPTPQAFLFGVCDAGGTSPICAANPGTVPRAVDVITPVGVDQTVELDPTQQPVLIQGVPVP